MGEFGSPEEPRRSHGHSMVVGPWGDVLVEAPEEGSGVWFADVDTAELRRSGRCSRRWSIGGSGLTC